MRALIFWPDSGTSGEVKRLNIGSKFIAVFSVFCVQSQKSDIRVVLVEREASKVERILPPGNLDLMREFLGKYSS